MGSVERKWLAVSFFRAHFRAHFRPWDRLPVCLDIENDSSPLVPF
jgi:hypothetical protein